MDVDETEPIPHSDPHNADPKHKIPPVGAESDPLAPPPAKKQRSPTGVSHTSACTMRVTTPAKQRSKVRPVSWATGCLRKRGFWGSTS